MIKTAVDSSVLLDVFLGDPVHANNSAELLFKCFQEGSLVACDVVWAEVRPKFEQNKTLLEIALQAGLGFDPLNRESSLLAGEIYRKYKQSGGKKERIIPDFLIAAHAFVQADRLLTRDRGFYRVYFPKLEIISP